MGRTKTPSKSTKKLRRVETRGRKKIYSERHSLMLTKAHGLMVASWMRIDKMEFSEVIRELIASEFLRRSGITRTIVEDARAYGEATA